MLSRTADHLFWMARYIERAGHAAQRHGAKPQHSSAGQGAAGFSAFTEVRCAL